MSVKKINPNGLCVNVVAEIGKHIMEVERGNI